MSAHDAPRPAEQFATPEHVLDFPAIAAALRHEAAAAPHGHRQRTVHRHERTTMVLFAFDAGGTLREHSANGLVMIHVVAGTLHVRTPAADHALGAGMALVLEPRVPHSVTAAAPADMLLTVSLEPRAA